MTLGWALASALAAPPPGDSLRPFLVSPTAVEAHAARRREAGEAEDPLACEVAWAGTHHLCFRVWEEDRRRPVHRSDLVRWGLSVEELHRGIAASAAQRLAGAEVVPIQGMSASWLKLLDGDGWAAAGLLRPDLVAERLGGAPIRLAVPIEGALVAWRAQGAEVDHVMAVAVREIFDQGPARVSAKVWTWDGHLWTPFGEAVLQQP